MKALLATLFCVLPLIASPVAAESPAPPAPPVDLMQLVEEPVESADCSPGAAEVGVAELAPGAALKTASTGTICSPCSQSPCENVAEGNLCVVSGRGGYCLEQAVTTCGDVQYAPICVCSAGSEPVYW